MVNRAMGLSEFLVIALRRRFEREMYIFILGSGGSHSVSITIHRVSVLDIIELGFPSIIHVR